MANITPVAVTHAGTPVPRAAATAGGDTITNATTTTRLIVDNGSGAGINVTLTAVRACSDGFLHDVVVAVAAGAKEEILIPGKCIDPDTAHVAVAYSASATVTVAATA